MPQVSEKYQLLAKAKKEPKAPPRPGESLSGHIRMVMASFEAMFGNSEGPTHLGKCWLRFFKLTPDSYQNFWLHGVVACALHDLGKANEDFQKLVRYELKDGQLIRHEHLSGLLMCWPSSLDWLQEIQDLDVWIVFSAVVSHHLKVKFEEFAVPKADRSLIKIYPEGIQAIYRLLAAKLKREAPVLDLPALWNTDDSSFGESIGDLREQIEDSLDRFERSLRNRPEKVAFLNAVRAALILADSAGSGLSRELHDEAHLEQAIQRWLKDVFNEEGLQSGDDIENKVISKRVQQIETQTGQHFEWGDFQSAAAGLPDRTLLLAACGSGKTLAAWRWIQSRLADKPKARVIFLYPTRATATEGFRDYVAWAPESDAAMVHGTSAYELDGLFSNPQDERFGKDFTTEDRLFAIGYWPKRIFSATVDQFLGFMQFIYRSVCLMPLLVDSVLVIDEVHSFDHGMFSALKQFLKHFDVPVLCMTASLPNQRQAELTACGLEIFPADVAAFTNLQTLAELPRYQLTTLEQADDALSIALAGRAAGKRVLWVVNTVDRCQELAQNLNAICYHSRFKLDDRKKSHEQVVQAFQQKDQPVLAITTQVCEMSLDLDAEILISEVAPIPALIQRMGRCNRKARTEGGPLGQVYVYQPEKILPYDKEELTGVEAFLADLAGRPISQRDLEIGLAKHDASGKQLDRYSAFLQSGPWAFSADYHFRDSLDLSVQAVLDTDIKLYLDKKKRREPTDGLILPAPKQMALIDSRLERLFLKKVLSANYSQSIGLIKSSSEVTP